MAHPQPESDRIATCQVLRQAYQLECLQFNGLSETESEASPCPLECRYSCQVLRQTSNCMPGTPPDILDADNLGLQAHSAKFLQKLGPQISSNDEGNLSDYCQPPLIDTYCLFNQIRVSTRNPPTTARSLSQRVRRIHPLPSSSSLRYGLYGHRIHNRPFHANDVPTPEGTNFHIAMRRVFPFQLFAFIVMFRSATCATCLRDTISLRLVSIC